MSLRKIITNVNILLADITQNMNFINNQTKLFLNKLSELMIKYDKDSLSTIEFFARNTQNSQICSNDCYIELFNNTNMIFIKTVYLDATKTFIDPIEMIYLKKVNDIY